MRRTQSSPSAVPLARGRLAARDRIAAIADPGSVAPIDDALSAPRPSPHLARWRIESQDDDGIVVARATIRGAAVLVAAQDERFVGGSAGVRHAAALRALFERALTERPAAVVLLAASAGVRLHEANPAELALARALAALMDLRVAGVRVLSIVCADVFGGASVLACAGNRIAMLPGTKLGLSGPKVIEQAHGRDELAADDAAAVAALMGATARADAGQVEQVADDAEAVREWIARAAPHDTSFATDVLAMHARLAERLRDVPFRDTAIDAREIEVPPLVSLPRRLSPIYADATPVDRDGWLWQVPGEPVWLTRALGIGTFGPREAFAFDAALLAQFDAAGDGETRTLFVVADSAGHETTARAEALCVSQYLAQHAAVLALLRIRGVRLIGLLAGVGHGAAFFANTLQAPQVYALPDARVVAMDPAAIARVTGRDAAELAALIEDDPLVGQPVRHFAAWGGIASILPDASRDRLLALARAEPAPPRR